MFRWWILAVRLFFIVPLSFFCKVASAFPNGAGSCAAGKLAIQNGPHIAANNLTGTGPILDNGYLVLVGMQLLANPFTIAFNANMEHNITLMANGVDDFRGFLLRLSKTNDSTNTTGMLATTTNDSVPGDEVSPTQVSTRCTNLGVAGLTHTNGRMDKRSIAGVLDFDGELGIYTLDVTVVTNTNSTASTAEWYFSSFQLQAIDGPMPTFAPTLVVVTTPAPTPDCEALRADCQSSSECCSNKCGGFDENGDGTCLQDPNEGSVQSKAAQKLSTGDFGGAGGAAVKAADEL